MATTKRRFLLLLCLLVFVVSTSLSKALAQGEGLVLVRFVSFPSGASVAVDDQIMGNTTNLTLHLKSGVYSVRVSLPGFVDWEDKVLVYGAENQVYAYLRPGPELLRLPSQLLGLAWASSSNKLRFISNTKSPYVYDSFDIDKGVLTSNTPPLDAYSNIDQLSELLSKLGTAKNGIFPLAFMSPRGRYLLYVPKDEQAFLQIFDSKNNRILKTNIGFSSPTHDVNGASPFVTPDPDYYPLWSLNETAILVIAHNFSDLLFISDGQVQTISLHDFKSETGEKVYTRIFGDPIITSVPTEDRKVLTWGRIFGPADETGPLMLWLVDLNTMTGKVVPLNEIYDAVFSSDGKSIYVAHKRGISRLNLDLKVISSSSETIASMWGICHVSLSPTLNYAYIDAESCHEAGSGYWLYKLPQIGTETQ